uniref:Chitin-binding type-2 domain-containing protein n=1 Tax=Triatoma infestans TaxID=30076 RepID=A0A161M9G0_TRIIF
MIMAFKQLFVSVLIIAAQYHPTLGQDAPTSEPKPNPGTQPEPATKPEPGTTPDPPEEMPKIKCVSAGFVCSDCNNQAVCIGSGDGSFVQIENACAKGSHCIEDQCVAGAKCNYRKFQCTAEGFFPDPFDCTKYHVCMYDDSIHDYKGLEFNCGEGRGSYDATSGSCGFALNSTACTEGPVPRCITSLQIGVLKSDPSIYYICTEDEKTLGPQLYKCGGGKMFDTKKVSCVATKKK